MYTGQISFAPEKKQGQRVVLDLVKGLGQGYEVTCDNFFTSIELAKELAKQNKTLLGTMRQIRSTKNHVALQITRGEFKLVFVFKRCNDDVICSSQKQICYFVI